TGEPIKRDGQRLRISRGYQQSSNSVCHYSRDASDGARDHRPSGEHRLQNAAGPSLGKRGQYETVAFGQKGGYVRAMILAMDPSAEAAVSDQPPDVLGVSFGFPVASH